MLFIILLNKNALGLVSFNSLLVYWFIVLSDLIVNSKVNCRGKLCYVSVTKKLLVMQNAQQQFLKSHHFMLILRYCWLNMSSKK